MKLKSALLVSLCIASTCFAKYVPTPEMAMTLPTAKDTVKWVPQHMDGNASGIIFELVPEGQNINAWTEMVAQQITFTKDSALKHINGWEKMIKNGDPNVEITRENNSDGSYLVTYKSKAFNEYSVRRFIKAADGIYALAYHIRLNQMDEGRIQLWVELIRDAKLIPNPEKNR
jgi:hypothetical protein